MGAIIPDAKCKSTVSLYAQISDWGGRRTPYAQCRLKDLISVYVF